MLHHAQSLGRGGHAVSHVQPARELAARGRADEQAEATRAHLAGVDGTHAAALQGLREELVVVEGRLRLLPRPHAIQLLPEVALPRGGKAPLLQLDTAEGTLPISQLPLIGRQSLVEGLKGRVGLQCLLCLLLAGLLLLLSKRCGGESMHRALGSTRGSAFLEKFFAVTEVVTEVYLPETTKAGQ